MLFREINFDKFGEYANYLRNHHFQYAFGEYWKNPINSGSIKLLIFKHLFKIFLFK